MKRRGFIGHGATASWPLVAVAQKPIPVIAFLNSGTYVAGQTCSNGGAHVYHSSIKNPARRKSGFCLLLAAGWRGCRCAAASSSPSDFTLRSNTGSAGMMLSRFDCVNRSDIIVRRVAFCTAIKPNW
jgi:hypothetical protein